MVAGPYKKCYSRPEDVWYIYDGDAEEVARLQTEALADTLMARLGVEGYCPQALSGRHEPDPASVLPADGAGKNRGTDWIVEVRCKHCGQFGSVQIDPQELQWD